MVVEVAVQRGDAHLGVALHVTVPDKAPAKHEYVPAPVWTYAGVLHVGVHDIPLGRLDVHVPKALFAGAVIVHGLALHTAVSVRLAPS